MSRTLPLALLALWLGPAAPAADKVTLESLLRQMTDLSLLAEYPDPPYVTKQFSSYDRASETPGRESWFANADRGFMLYDGVTTEDTPYLRSGPAQGRPPDGIFPKGTKVGLAPTHRPRGDHVWAYATAPDGRPTGGKIPQGYVKKAAIRMDPQGHVLAEMDGPGCVVRIWSANPNDAGNIRIYLDGAREPVIDAPMQDLLGGRWKTRIDGKEVTPFPDPIACERSRGYNLYFPIAYARHCKITIDRPDIYYHVDYRTYPKGTEIETFSLDALARIGEPLTTALDRLQGRARAQEKETRWAFEQEMKPGGSSIAIATPSGTGGVITRIDVEISGYKNDAEISRELVLTGWFGGEGKQIWCPLGDFFGSGLGLNPSSALPVRVAKKEKGTVRLTSYWRMPYERSVQLYLENFLTKEHPFVRFGVQTEPYRWTDRSMNFHAKWRTETLKTRPFRDWTYCDLKGQGVFVGDVLSVMNPVTAWWGEGDEKIYVDGEKFPSWFGTGTEDYYGYAWSDPKPFRHAYHNQTRCDGPGTRGWSSVNRFHVLDAIPFEKSFRFDMEVWHWTPDIEIPYAATSYWYARPGATDDFRPVNPRVLQNLPSPPPPYKVPGAIEGETLKIVARSSPFDVDPQDMAPFTTDRHRWSGDSQLWVRPPRVGDWVDLELPVAADGKYHVIVYLTRAQDYGTIRFRLNGQALGRPIDCYHAPEVVSTGPIDLGVAELKKGPATLRVEVVGSNARSVGLRYMWGLDCVVLKK